MHAQASEPPSRKLVATRTPGVYKRGTRYVVRYRDHAGKQKQRAARTYDEARRLRSALTADVARGEHRELSRVKFVDYVETWGATFTGRTGTGIRPETLDDYRRNLKRCAVPFFGRRRLVEIEPRDVKAFAAHLAGQGLAPATVRNLVAPLRALLATAVEEGLIRHNPATGLRLPSRSHATLDDEDEGTIKALTADELTALIAATPDDWRRLLVRFTAATGLRISEVIALRWKCLDLSEGRVLVRRRIYLGREDVPKSKYGRRDVPISAQMVAALKRHRLASRYSRDGDYVFPAATGTAHRYENLLRRVLKPAAIQAGLTTPVVDAAGAPIVDAKGEAKVTSWVGWHTLRHTCASSLFTRGANAKQVQVWLGHHSPAFTLERYVHLLPDDLPDGEILDDVVGL